MSSYFKSDYHSEATSEDRNHAAELRKEMISWVDATGLTDDVADMIKWMICRVSEESIIRKIHRGKAENWFENTISQLEPGTTFTQRGLLDEFHAPNDVRNYAQFVLCEWADSRHLIRFSRNKSMGLMATTITTNVYEVL